MLNRATKRFLSSTKAAANPGRLQRPPRPTKPAKPAPIGAIKYDFYDLVCRTPTHPTHPIEASLMSAKDLKELKKHTKTTFEGNYYIDNTLTPEERIAKVFGGRIKGEAPQSSSRVSRGEPHVIAGITVPQKPGEPDNCCMSGCINCVWELFEEDIKDWNDKRKRAAIELKKRGGRWPENFNAPVSHLNKENLPLSLANKSHEELHTQSREKMEEEEAWGNVPVSIRVFAELEKKMKEKRRLRAVAAKEERPSAQV